ncbi:MAG: hypothetical protein R2932_40605 [Caldilineaceae bacterium]
MKPSKEAKQITATLPALGTYTISFYKESATVIDCFGEKELQRLGRVDHLGITSKIFTGASHSRLEYALLQCAIIELLPKFHKDDERFAISNKVILDHLSQPLSSGEELLKSWALLSNFGHMQFTYGPERALLQFVKTSPRFRKKLLDGHWCPDMRRWCENVIDEHVDTDFHFVLTLHRICQMTKRSKTKGMFMHMLRNLLLPLDELHIQEQAQRYKLFRLRKIYGQVRQLCIVALDAYYSHQPIRYQIAGALIDLNRLLDESETRSGFLSLLRETAGWLAEEIYMHPNAAAIVRQYEIDAHKKLEREDQRLANGVDKFDDFLRNAMQNGFGEPRVGHLLPFLRMSFPLQDFLRYSTTNLNNIRGELEKRLLHETAIRISVLRNPYSDKIHLDFLISAADCTPKHIFQLYAKLYTWFARRLEAEAQLALRRLPRFPKAQYDEVLAVLRPHLLAVELNQNFSILSALLECFIQFLLPEGYSGVISEYLPSREDDRPIQAQFSYLRGGSYDGLSDKLTSVIKDNPANLPNDRIHELKTLLHVVTHSKAGLIIACTEKFLIKSSTGKRVDDWDGVVLEISEQKVALKVIEAKNGKGYKKAANEAFKQLDTTRELLTRRHKISYRRKRLTKHGAYIEFRL